MSAAAEAIAAGLSTGADAGLVRNCLDGDQDAWNRLVARYERLIYSVAIKICRDPEMATDVLQQVFLELYLRLHDVKNTASLAAWVATVTRRKTCDYLRAAKPTEPILDDDLFLAKDMFAQVEREHTLEKLLATLPARNRRLMEMLYTAPDDYSYEQIAQQLGIPVASIGPTRTRCLKKLRKLLS
jgi:RNA polymerase sigma factor (sigma-70 family)